jgi:hypothetical protein
LPHLIPVEALPKDCCHEARSIDDLLRNLPVATITAASPFLGDYPRVHEDALALARQMN